jgi:uncharacterized membrane protein
MKKFGSWLEKNVYNLMLWTIGVLNVLPILAPILAFLKINFLANAIYYMYSFFCHQLHWRSLHICDYQYGWCSRCTFIWLNVLLSGIAVKIMHVKRIKWYWYAVFLMPLILDGVIQTIATLFGLTTISNIYYMSNNFIRMLTGSLFGLGFGLAIWTNLQDSGGPESEMQDGVAEKANIAKAKKKKSISVLKLTLVTMITSLALYFLAVVVWNQTSTQYKPLNLLDFGVKIPPLAEDFLIRRVNGVR